MTRQDRRAATRYAEIETVLLHEIETGQQPVGTCLPTEHELADRFNASRFTIRRALAGLREAGLIEPRPGIGTFVISDRPRAGFVQTLGSLEEMLQYPSDTLREVVATGEVEAEGDLALMLACAPGTRWTTLAALRRKVGGPVITWIDAWIDPRFGDLATAPNPAGHALLRQIEEQRNHRAAEAQVDIFARRLPDRIAPALDAAPGAPCLVIRRRYRGEDGAIYLATETFHPEDRFALRFDFARG